MCKKKQFKYCPSEIDECLKNAIFVLSKRFKVNIVACCCGHQKELNGKYPMTIVIKDKLGVYELFSGEEISRRSKFYKKDKDGYYFIPETIK